MGPSKTLSDQSSAPLIGTWQLITARSTGAGDGIRTREYQLGRLTPYHLATPAGNSQFYPTKRQSICAFPVPNNVKATKADAYFVLNYASVFLLRQEPLGLWVFCVIRGAH